MHVHRLRPGDRGRDRAGLSPDTAPAARHWLLVRGRGERPLPAKGFTLERHSSTRRPTVAKGDLAVCYASVWQSVFAVVEVTTDPEEDTTLERWRWSFGIRPLFALDDLDRSIPAEEVGVFPSSLWRHSYIRLREEQFEAARAALEAACDQAGTGASEAPTSRQTSAATSANARAAGDR